MLDRLVKMFGGEIMTLINKEIVINKDINGRQAANFAHSISSMPFNVGIIKGDQQINGKSILELLSADLKSGDIINVYIDKNDPNGLNEIVKLINL